MSNQVQQAHKQNNHAVITGTVLNKIKTLENEGSLTFPPNYNARNAVQAAYLKIKDTEDKNNRPALDVCTQDSVVQAVMSMVVQGLNPGKNQCYFIVYGNKLVMQRSYFGSIAVAKQLNPNIEDIYAEVVYQDDVFKMSKKRGKTVVSEHVTALENIDKKKIKAAYVTVLYDDGREESIVMTIDQIHQAWKQSKTSVFDDKGNINEKSTHGKFTEEMAKKSVINRLCKQLINTTDDSILAKSIRESDEVSVIDDAKQTIDINANKEDFIDITPRQEETYSEEEQDESEQQKQHIVDYETGELIEVEETAEEELF